MDHLSCLENTLTCPVELAVSCWIELHIRSFRELPPLLGQVFGNSATFESFLPVSNPSPIHPYSSKSSQENSLLHHVGFEWYAYFAQLSVSSLG